MQRANEDAPHDLRDAFILGVGHGIARRRLGEGWRPRRAAIAWERRDFGEARMVYAASDVEQVSFAGAKRRASAALAKSSRVASWAAAKAFQYSPGMLFRAAQLRIVWIVTVRPRLRLTAMGPPASWII